MDEHPEETLVDKLYQHARTRPAAPALEDASSTISWAELGMATNRIACALRRRGLNHGARVGLLTDSDVRGATLILGALKAGLSAVPLPALIGADAIARAVADSGAKILFVSSRMRKHIAPDLATAPLLHVGIDFADARWMALESFLDGAADADLPIKVRGEDEFNIIYSSGTTGRPKGIIHSHALRADTAVRLGPLAFPLGVSTLVCTAIYSNYTMGALIYTLWAGGCLRFLSKFSGPALIEVAREFQPNNVYLVPVQIAQLLETSEVTAQLPSLPPAIKWTAGSYLSPDLKRRLLEAWPGGLLELYGMTEGAPVTLLVAHQHPDKLHTVGRSTPPEDVKIIDDNDAECSVGTRGEVVGRIRSVMNGYNNNEEATKALHWYDSAGIPYFRSGDIGVLDEDGFLQVTDRKKDMIISGGFNIYASDIEEALLSHPAVAEAAAFAALSRKWGETPVAAVVVKADHSVSSEEIREWTNARLGRLQRIAAVAITDKLPRGALDKVLKRELRTRYAHLGDGDDTLRRN
jgi:long-chain acyl-CoA synthetase